jgi:hypothetical protein
MSFLIVEDAPKPQYIVVVAYTEHEQASHLFITEEAAKAFAAKHTASEVIVARIIDSIA